MTLKEAVLKSLEEINELTNYLEVYNHIIEKNYYDFGIAKTPSSTVTDGYFELFFEYYEKIKEFFNSYNIDSINNIKQFFDM